MLVASSMLDAWEREELGDFQSRLATNSRIPETTTEPPLLSFTGHTYEEGLNSNVSSRFAQGGRSQSSRSMDTANTLPELDGSTSTSSSTSSETVDPSVVGGQLLESDNGVLVIPDPLHRTPPQPRCRYQCLFHILDCGQSFGDTETWKIHVLSHFRSHPSPTDARCPLCPGSVSHSQRDVAWEAMLDHVAETHFPRGDPLAWSRPDFELIRYLFELKVITFEQLKMVQLASAPWSPGYNHSQEWVGKDVGSASDPVCVSANSKRERRMRGLRNR